MLKKLNLLFITLIILTTVFFTGCLTDKNDLEEESNFSYPFRLAQFTGNTYLRFSYSEDTAIENWTVKVEPEGIIFYENSGVIIPETPEFKGQTSGTHLWECYGQKNGTTELDFKLVSLLDNSIKERFIYQVDVDENNRAMKLISVHQLKTPDNPLETKLKIKENKVIDIEFQEYANLNEKWILEISGSGDLKKMDEEVVTSEIDEINIRKWEFEGEKQGSIQLIYKFKLPDGTRTDEITYDIYVYEDMTIELIDADYRMISVN